MRIGRRAAVIVCLLAVLALAGCIWVFHNLFNNLWYVKEFEAEISRPYIPKEGEETHFIVYAYRDNPNNAVEVEVTLTDLKTNESFTLNTDVAHGATFRVVVGRSYMLTANYKGSTKSITFTMKPLLLGDIIISGDYIKEISVYQGAII